MWNGSRYVHTESLQDIVLVFTQGCLNFHLHTPITCIQTEMNCFHFKYEIISSLKNYSLKTRECDKHVCFWQTYYLLDMKIQTYSSIIIHTGAMYRKNVKCWPFQHWVTTIVYIISFSFPNTGKWFDIWERHASCRLVSLSSNIWTKSICPWHWNSTQVSGDYLTHISSYRNISFIATRDLVPDDWPVLLKGHYLSLNPLKMAIKIPWCIWRIF